MVSVGPPALAGTVYVPLPGVTTVGTATYDAEITIANASPTPLTLSGLSSGHYEVTGEFEGFPRQTLGVDLKDGELQEVRFTFGKQP